MMIAKDTIIDYMKALEDELEMNKGKSITPQFADYLGNILDKYEKFKGYFDKYDKIIKTNTNNTDDDADFDEINNSDFYELYIEYKEKYKDTHKQSDLDQSQSHLKMFLDNLIEIFANIEEVSRDDMKERSLIKDNIKKIYQTFN